MNDHTKKFDDIFPTYVSGIRHTVLLPRRVSDEIDWDRDVHHAVAAAIKSLDDGKTPAEVGPWGQAARDRAAAAEKMRKAEEAANAPVMPGWKAKRIGKKSVMHRLYNERLLASTSAGSLMSSVKDEKERQRLAVVHRFWVALGGRRRIALPVDGWRAALDALAAEMPNFSSVIDYLAGEFALAELAKQPPCLAPMLLDGPPGVGKTTFARKLANLFRTGFISVSMETSQTAAALSGSEQYWGNSKPGRLFTMLMEGEFANPVVLVDEVDKARASHGYDPAAALYGLLESGSAAQWSDLSVPYLTIDASRVMWILTSNVKQQIPEPLLSRMRVFDIASLTADQALHAVGRIFAEVVRELGIDFDQEVPLAMAIVMAAMSPREMRRVAREMVARAVLAARRQVVMDDLGSQSQMATRIKATGVSVTFEVSEETIDDELATATKH